MPSVATALGRWCIIAGLELPLPPRSPPSCAHFSATDPKALSPTTEVVDVTLHVGGLGIQCSNGGGDEAVPAAPNGTVVALSPTPPSAVVLLDVVSPAS